MPQRIRYRELLDVLEVDGINVPGRFLRSLAKACKSGLPFQVIGQGGQLTITGLAKH